MRDKSEESSRCHYSFSGVQATTIYKGLAKRFNLPEEAYRKPYASRNMQIVHVDSEIMTVNIGAVAPIIDNRIEHSWRLDLSISRKRLGEIEQILKSK